MPCYRVVRPLQLRTPREIACSQANDRAKGTAFGELVFRRLHRQTLCEVACSDELRNRAAESLPRDLNVELQDFLNLNPKP